jgi:formiminoglutamate deiminase
MTASGSSTYLLERAWVDGAVRDDVLVSVEDGRFTSVTHHTGSDHFTREVSRGERWNPRISGETNATRIPGLTLPGLANCHSHAFHRALRGRTQRERGTFWTWRDRMYDVAARLDPDSYFALARATYREMAAAGITCVGEFHYLHHQPDGTPYDDPNAMGHALVEAAREAGIRICLLDTLYLSSGFGEPPQGVQRRFSDGSGQQWVVRQQSHRLDRPGVVLGSAIHSVRAVPADQFQRVAEWGGGSPIHLHLSEQVAENQACVAEYARTPTELLADHDLLDELTTVVHATHLTADDIRLLGSTRTNACFCPTTERDLGDGIGPSRQLHDAGATLTLGSDSHAVIDLFEEMRAVELDERLATQERGHWSAPELLEAATSQGHRSLGFDDAGAIAVGQRADLVTIGTASTRTAGSGADENTAVFAATAEDVTQVMVNGRVVVRQGDREEIGRELDAAIAAVWEGMS